ncbi:MAG TPA: hypothetical protein VGE40_11750 [Bacilli bacterium]
MYENGQHLTEDNHFQDHIEHEVPVQVYLEKTHDDIGFVEKVSQDYIKVNDTFYSRQMFTFVSRPGY